VAIVDSLLKLVAVRGADALVVQSGEVPHLLKDGDRQSLSMPVPGSDVIGTIISEIASDEQHRELEAGDSVVALYRCADDSMFTVRVDAGSTGYTMTFHPGAGVEPQPPKSGGVADVLQHAHSVEASDVLLSSNGPPRIRVGGKLQTLDQLTFSVDDILQSLSSAMGEEDHARLKNNGSCDLAFTEHGVRYRVNVFQQERGIAAAFRPIRSNVPSLDDLNLPSHFYELTKHRSGLVLMVGTAGSGKSTTLVALIEQLNRSVDKHVITLEDPIEYLYEPKRCLIHQREVGRHVPDFSTGLRAALRESPDVILVGEMRDRETITAALTAAETGHLVLSTLHSGSAAMAIDRIVDVFPEHQQQQVRYQLSDVLRAVVTQFLLPSTTPPLRVPAYEKLAVTSAVSTKIRENRTHQIETELQKGRASGMVPLELSLARLVQRRLLSLETAHEMAGDPLYLEQLIKSR
jgi:twitching motility protein PilT